MFDRIFKLGFEATMLTVESQQVVALRLLHMASGGPSAMMEAHRMVAEKAVAAVESSARIAAGQGPGAIMKLYRAKVRANRDRLHSADVA